MNPKKVVFCSNQELHRADDIAPLYNEPGDYQKTFLRIPRTQSEFEHFRPKADVIVTDDFLPVRPDIANVRIMLTGHGITGGKHWGLDQPTPWIKAGASKQLTYALCTSPDTIDIMASATGLPTTQVLPIGIPRTDAYFKKPGKLKGPEDSELKEYVGPSLDNKKVYFFVPSFRNVYDPEYPKYPWGAIDKYLHNDEVLIVKRHPNMAKPVLDKGYRHIFERDSKEPTTPWMLRANVVITDYSSLMMDALLLEKPLVLYCPDYKEFDKKRGMYFPYPEGYSSFYVLSPSAVDFVDCIRCATFDTVGKKMKQVTAGSCDGNVTKRVMEIVKEMVME